MPWGIFFLSLDAQVRGTGDVVNSLKSEGGRGGWGWAVVSAGRLNVMRWHFEGGGTNPALTHQAGSQQTVTVWNLNGWISLLCCLCVCGSVTQASVCVALLLRLRHIAVLICRGLASLNVLLVDEHFDALFDHADTGVEPGFGLIDDLHTNETMRGD